MSEENKLDASGDALEFTPVEVSAPSSPAVVPQEAVEPQAPMSENAAGADTQERSPAFKILAEAELPPIESGNRAKLLMQTPNRLFFYWSTSRDPLRLLTRALGGNAGNYSLVLKLEDLRRGTEEIHRIEPEGTWWFDVEADGRYRAEIGFYSTGRPFVRIMYSNVVETPRKTPSPRSAETAEWRTSSEQFSKVLDIAGFKKDAFDVALAGDDAAASETAAHAAFGEFVGREDLDYEGIPQEELRYALMTLAAGAPLASLRFKIGARLFGLLEEHSQRLSADEAASSLRKHFKVEVVEFLEEDSLPAVFGASVVNFPRKFRYNPLRDHQPITSRGKTSS
ncbi:MAG: DUF4912 domain-containing protein [Pyrinomonadaceae bacterium]